MDPTIDPDSAQATTFDAVVVGGGPAGSAAAIFAARRGLRVLLLECRTFPRVKVCGGCLGPTGRRILARASVLDEVRRAGAVPLSALRLSTRGASTRFPLVQPGGEPAYLGVSRATLDTLLVRQAIREGAHWLPRTRIAAGAAGPRGIELHGLRAGGPFRVRARVAVLASGLAGVDPARFGLGRAIVDAASHVGLAAVLGGGATPARGEIEMHCDRAGYVGLCRLDDGRVHVAAALAPGAARDPRAGVLERIARPGGEPPRPGDLRHLAGTPALTRRPQRRAALRVLVAGDAAGYVEPFTGEGITWALASGELAARAAATVARGGWSDVAASAYESAWNERVGARQRGCRVVARLLRRPACLGAAMAVARRSERLRSWIARPFARPDVETKREHGASR